MSNQYQKVIDLNKEAMDKNAIRISTALIAALGGLSAYDAAKQGKKTYESIKKGDTKQAAKDAGWLGLDSLGVLSSAGWLASSMGKGGRIMRVASKLGSKAAKLSAQAAKTSDPKLAKKLMQQAARYQDKAKKISTASSKVFKNTKAISKAKQAKQFTQLAKTQKGAMAHLTGQATNLTKSLQAAQKAGDPKKIKAIQGQLNRVNSIIQAGPKAAQKEMMSQAYNLSQGMGKIRMGEKIVSKGGGLGSKISLNAAKGVEALKNNKAMQMMGKGLSATGRGITRANMAPMQAINAMGPGIQGAMGRGIGKLTNNRAANLAKGYMKFEYGKGMIPMLAAPMAYEAMVGPREPVEPVEGVPVQPGQVTSTMDKALKAKNALIAGRKMMPIAQGINIPPNMPTGLG